MHTADIYFGPSFPPSSPPTLILLPTRIAIPPREQRTNSMTENARSPAGTW
jgi:hypothetical protein